MRRLVLLLPLLAGCVKSDAPKDQAAPAAPAAMSEADIAGTWTGSFYNAKDSLLGHWTQVCAGGTCHGTTEGQPDTVVSTYAFGADSTVGSVAAMKNPLFPGLMVTERWVSRVPSAGKVTGTGTFMLADKPDSVVLRFRFEGARKP